MKRYLPFLLIILVFVAVVIGATLLVRRESGPKVAPDLATRPLTVANPPRTALPGANPPRVKGEANAAVTIEEFGDYQCPPCGALRKEIERLDPAYAKQVKLIFRHFPLVTMHENAVDAARAAEAAGMQNRFWQMHNQLYMDQSRWSKAKNAREIFTEYARNIGLDLQKFERDRDLMETNSRIQLDLQRGESLGVHGTPTVFLNGRELTLNAAGDLQKEIASELKKLQGN